MNLLEVSGISKKEGKEVPLAETTFSQKNLRTLLFVANRDLAKPLC
jgi:hypothetical protein